MMTLAMAFFSIALTLNLTGIHVTQMRAADLQPSRLRATLTRQYYATNEQVTKYYENLRLVYEMEARVRELRRSRPKRSPRPGPPPRRRPIHPPANATGAAAPAPLLPRESCPSPTEPPPASRDARPAEMVPAARPRARPGGVWPPRCPPGTTLTPATPRDQAGPKIMHQVFRALSSTTEDQAKRSLV